MYSCAMPALELWSQDVRQNDTHIAMLVHNGEMSGGSVKALQWAA